MKQLVQRIMRKLDLRVVRASNVDRLLAQAQAAQDYEQARTRAELSDRETAQTQIRAENAERASEEARTRAENAQRESAEARTLAELAERETAEARTQLEAERQKVSILTETSMALRARLDDDQPTDHITSRIPTYGPEILPHDLAAMCNDYTALRAPFVRERVSRELLRSVIANPSLGAVLMGPGTPDSLKPHELYRQTEAAMSFAAGRLEDAERGFKLLCTDLPSAFNFACCARVHLARNNQRDAFAALTDGTDRFPTDVALNLELAAFFMRIGDVEAANFALAPVKHAFVGESFALSHLRDDVDLAVKHVQRSQPEGAKAESDAWWEQWRSFAHRNEFQDPVVALGEALERALVDILNKQSGDTTSVIEFGVGCAHTLASVARRYPHIRFVGIDHTRSANQFNESVFRADNLTFLTGDTMHHLTHAEFGGKPILFHGDVGGKSHPAMLASLYEKCRDLGTRHILAVEELDFDCINLRYHDADDPSNNLRMSSAGRLMHNFPRLLQAAGYIISARSPVTPVLVAARPPFAGHQRLLHATLQA